MFRIIVAYDGTAYHGWQVQPDQPTVQGELERAAERLNGEPTRILGAGRTDAGVHARGQAARFLTTRNLVAAEVPRALNAFLPSDVVVRGAVAVRPGFHPIGDAREKRYRYTFRVAPYADPLVRRYVMRIDDELDVGRMQAVAARLVGCRDFSAFEKSGSPRESTVRNLSVLDVSTQDDYIRIDLVANGFLYGMARNLAGTLLRAGRGALAPEDIPSAGPFPRDVAGPHLPAHGLCLLSVSYPSPQ